MQYNNNNKSMNKTTIPLAVFGIAGCKPQLKQSRECWPFYSYIPNTQPCIWMLPIISIIFMIVNIENFISVIMNLILGLLEYPIHCPRLLALNWLRYGCSSGKR